MHRTIRNSWLLLAWVAGMSGPCAAQAPSDAQTTQAAAAAASGQPAVPAGSSRAQVAFENGLRLVDAGRIDAAIEVFAGLTRDYPRLPQPFQQLAALQARKGNYHEAATALQAALGLQTDPAPLQEQLGDLYLALAARAYRSALDAGTSAAGVRDKYSTVEALKRAPATR